MKPEGSFALFTSSLVLCIQNYSIQVINRDTLEKCWRTKAMRVDQSSKKFIDYGHELKKV